MRENQSLNPHQKLLAVSGNTDSKLNNVHRVRGFRVFGHKWDIFITPLPSRLRVLRGRGDGMIVRSRGGQWLQGSAVSQIQQDRWVSHFINLLQLPLQHIFWIICYSVNLLGQDFLYFEVNFIVYFNDIWFCSSWSWATYTLQSRCRSSL